MGFLKRFFSLGSKRSKRNKHRNHDTEPFQVDASGRLIDPKNLPAQDPKKEESRLLRSSSAHFSVVSEIDYSSLPPLPHPINSVINTPVPTPSKSTLTVDSGTGLQRRGTYTVTVHERQTHSRTEFPNANPPIPVDPPSPTPLQSKSKVTKLNHHDNRPEEHDSDEEDADDTPIRPTTMKSNIPRFNPRSVPFTPRDQSRILRLRQDPSVVSLLNMYDDKGRINSNAFSNTPPTPAAPAHSAKMTVVEDEGREQKRRGGSTLRELMTGDNNLADPNHARSMSMMGDISWAEHLLGELAHHSSSLSSIESVEIETPKDDHFDNTTIISDLSATSDSTSNDPSFSSTKVEVSSEVSNDGSDATYPYPDSNIASALPKTPQRTPARYLLYPSQALRLNMVWYPHSPHRPQLNTVRRSHLIGSLSMVLVMMRVLSRHVLRVQELLPMRRFIRLPCRP
ncbi:hypothetical protein C8Q75DRAFT_624214 [Abortiporus biennis]|nr:hypothetical protein C8Q75DRAFT_624214 [Abortiporus biennis]